MKLSAAVVGVRQNRTEAAFHGQFNSVYKLIKDLTKKGRGQADFGLLMHHSSVIIRQLLCGAYA